MSRNLSGLLLLIGLIVAGCAPSAGAPSAGAPSAGAPSAGAPANPTLAPIATPANAIAGTGPSATAPTALTTAVATVPLTSTALPAVGAVQSPAATVLSSTAPLTPTSPVLASATITVTAAATTTTQTVIISIKNYAFGEKDAPVTVKVGTTVIWRDDENVPHTVTADDKSYNSGDMLAGATFQHTFTQPGEYPYYCIWHGGPRGQGMASKIIVTR